MGKEGYERQDGVDALVGEGMAGCGTSEAVYISEIEQIGNQVYFLAHSLVSQNAVWWNEYVRQNSVFLVKDLDTGKVTVLYGF